MYTGPTQARIFWRGSVADPAHVILFGTNDGTAFSGSKFQYCLIRLLGWSISKTWKRNEAFRIEQGLKTTDYLVG
jgi:hypothetical protein